MPRSFAAHNDNLGQTRVVAVDDDHALSKHFTFEHQPPGGPSIALSSLKFQDGDASKVGVNGVTDVMVLQAVADRVKVQCQCGSQSACEAYSNIENAIGWLR